MELLSAAGMERMLQSGLLEQSQHIRATRAEHSLQEEPDMHCFVIVS